MDNYSDDELEIEEERKARSEAEWRAFEAFHADFMQKRAAEQKRADRKVAKLDAGHAVSFRPEEEGDMLMARINRDGNYRRLFDSAMVAGARSLDCPRCTAPSFRETHPDHPEVWSSYFICSVCNERFCSLDGTGLNNLYRRMPLSKWWEAFELWRAGRSTREIEEAGIVSQKTAVDWFRVFAKHFPHHAPEHTRRGGPRPKPSNMDEHSTE